MRVHARCIDEDEWNSRYFLYLVEVLSIVNNKSKMSVNYIDTGGAM